MGRFVEAAAQGGQHIPHGSTQNSVCFTSLCVDLLIPPFDACKYHPNLFEIPEQCIANYL